VTTSSKAPAQKYSVLRRIGEGGMAEVFVAEMLCQPGYSKRVAVKRVLPRLARNTRFMRMFLDEARLGLLLNHSNIVQVFDVGRADDAYFIVMEYVDGVNLKAIWERYQERRALLPLEVSLRIMIEVLNGLYYAHHLTDSRGNPLNVVHHDVNPANVLISTNGECKLVDFGLSEAAVHAERTDPDIVRGKFGYLAPEVAYGQGADARSDLYGLAIVLWELCTGRRLFEGKDDLESLALARAGRVSPPSSVNPTIPRSLDEVLLRALARHPDHRFADARDLAHELTEVLFELRQPVNAFTLGELVRKLQPSDDRSGRAALIESLIEEELLHIESLQYDDVTEPGQRPLWSL
jgi:serine/threonine-protein kinase